MYKPTQAPVYTYLALLIVSTPTIVWAQVVTDLNSLFDIIYYLIVVAIQLAFALAILGFFYGLALYIFKSGSKGANEQGIRLMVWGVVALFVMVSIWGIVEILQNSFGVDNSQTPGYPQLRIY